MQIKKILFDHMNSATIQIGRVGENEYTRIVFDCSSVFDQYPSAVPSMTIEPPDGEPYPAVSARERDNVVWDVRDTDLAQKGYGRIQLTFVQDNVVVKSGIGRLFISQSLLPEGEMPDPVADWLVEANTALNAIPQTIEDALQEAKDSGEFDGFSPVVGVEAIEDGHRVTITDAEGDHPFDVMNGEKGDPGENNIDDDAGIEGFDVTWSTNKLTKSIDGKANTILVSDETQRSIRTINDAADGMPLELTAQVRPNQNLNGYGRPWIGGTGKNLADMKSAYANNSAFVIVGDQVRGTPYNFQYNSHSIFRIPGKLLNAPVTFSAKIILSSTSVPAMRVYAVVNGVRINGNWGSEHGIYGAYSSVTFTPRSTSDYVKFECSSTQSAQGTCRIENIQLEEGSGVTSYEPYENVCQVSPRQSVTITRTGKNLFDKMAAGNHPYFCLDLTNGGLEYNDAYGTSDYIRIRGGSACIVSGFRGFGSSRACFYDSAKRFISGESSSVHAFPAPLSAEYIRFDYERENIALVQLEMDSAASEYADYSRQEWSVTFPSVGGDVYGGVLIVHKDGTGELKVNMKKVAIDGIAAPFTFASQINEISDYMNSVFGIASADAKRIQSGYIIGNIVSNKLAAITGGNAESKTTEYYGVFITDDSQSDVAVRVSIPKSQEVFTIEQANAWAHSIGGLYIVYETDSSWTYPLTIEQVKLVLGRNHIYTDSGDILKTEYSVDTKTYIDANASPVGTAGNFAGFGQNGKMTDSGKKPSDFIQASEKGAADGIATLNSTGHVPASQLPSYVDDIVNGYLHNGQFYQDPTHTTVITPEDGKIYVDLDTDYTYRWSGVAYIRINETDISGKADKVQNATSGNFAGLDENGNLTDSGMNAEDFILETSIATVSEVQAMIDDYYGGGA